MYICQFNWTGFGISIEATDALWTILGTELHSSEPRAPFDALCGYVCT